MHSMIRVKPYGPDAVTERGRRGSAGRPPIGVSPDVVLNWPINVELTIRREVHSFDLYEERIALLRGHRQIERDLERGLVDDDSLDAHKRQFIKQGRLLIRLQRFIESKDKAAYPPARGKVEQARRLEWLEQQARLAMQTELRQQRTRLREGHQTLSAIRRVLQGRDPLRRPGSAAATTSPT